MSGPDRQGFNYVGTFPSSVLQLRGQSNYIPPVVQLNLQKPMVFSRLATLKEWQLCSIGNRLSVTEYNMSHINDATQHVIYSVTYNFESSFE